MKILGRDIRPRTAFNRYGQAVNQGMNNPSAPNPMYGNADKVFYTLGQQPGIGQTLNYGFENPEIGAAALIGGTLANNLMGNPIGGAIDFISMDLTNLKPDAYVAEPQQQVVFVDSPSQEIVYTNRYGVSARIPSEDAAAVVAADTAATQQGLKSNLYSQPGMQNQIEIPQLTEEERAKFMKYTTNRTAQQILTYQALQDYLNQQPGMEEY